MADERSASREYPAWKPKPASWTKIFGTFLFALDPFKLLVAAGGIMATSLGWWLLSVIFYYSWSAPTAPDPKAYVAEESATDEAKKKLESDKKKADADYDYALARWALMYELAGPTNAANAEDAKRYIEWYLKTHPKLKSRNEDLAKGYGGKYRTMPWAEDRGPNPFYMTKTVVSGTSHERSNILSWFFSNQLPNLVEPLAKFLTPISNLFDPRANFWVYVYNLMLILWLLVVWAFFGGVLTRMSVLQLTGKEGGGLKESIRFVKTRYLSYLLSPALPILFIFAIVLGCMLFGLIHWVPLLGDFFDGILWFIPLLAGLGMTLTLIGMIGYPMMYTTLSTEGSDTFDALSRSYNYVYESPWHYVWYSFVAIVYGAALTLFVVSVGSVATYLGKWGVSKFPTYGADRSPEYLFVYSPTSLGWRELLTANSPAAIDDENEPLDKDKFQKYMTDFRWYNHAGAGMVSFWVTIFFLMIIGFGYSYFWTASTQIYLLMRKRVDETEMDEVYVEEEVAPYSPPVTTGTSTPAVTTPASAPAPTPAPAPVPTPTPPASTDAPKPTGDSSPNKPAN